MLEPARVTTDAEIDATIRQARIYEKYDQRVVHAAYSPRMDRFSLRTAAGAAHFIPRRLLQGLSNASTEELSRIEILGRGTGLYWPALDVAHSVSGILAGVYGSEKWMKHLQDQDRAKQIPA